MNRNPWTPDEVARMHAMLDDGLSWHLIGRALGRTAQSVRMRHSRENRHRQSRTRRYWRPHEDELLLDMCYDERSWAEIATALSRSAEACEQRLRRLLAERPAPPPEPEPAAYLLIIRAAEGWETAIARGPEDEVCGIYQRMSRSVEGLRVAQA